jgi:hypothetical protein
MKLRNTVVSLVAVAALFTACGGGGDTTNVVEDPDYGDLKPTTKTTYNVLSGETTYVSILTGNEFINTANAQSYYEYIIKDQGTAATAEFDTKNYGILRYKSSGAQDIVTVAIKDTRDGKESAPITLTFNPIEEAAVADVKVLKTGQTVGDWGVAKDFEEDADLNVKDNVYGLVWIDIPADAQVGRNVDYAEAKHSCETKGLRLPTVEELYTTISYEDGKYGINMLNDIFSEKLTYSWADDGKMMNNKNGYIAGAGDVEYRCVKSGAIPYVEHTVVTDISTEDTYDLSTNLQWSKSTSERKAFSDANTYCKDMVNGRGHDGWELPTINQLRSIADKGVLSAGIISTSPNLLSSTKVEKDGSTYYYGVIPTNERTDFTISTFNDTQPASITCVRPFTQLP